MSEQPTTGSTGGGSGLEQRVSRGGVVKLGAAGLAGVVGGVLATPGAAEAATDAFFEADGSQVIFTGTPAFSTVNENVYSGEGASIAGQVTGVTGRSIASGGDDGSAGGSGIGVFGKSGTGDGVLGESSGIGVHGITSQSTGVGVLGDGTLTSDGVYGRSGGYGVHGRTTSPTAAGVFGESTNGGEGVLGASSGNGVHGRTSNVQAYGVYGENTGGGAGVYGTTNSSGRSGVLGVNFDSSGAGSGVRGEGINGVEGVGSSAFRGYRV